MVCTQLLVSDKLVEVQNFKKITDHYRGFYGMYLKLMRKNRKVIQHVTGWTWETLGFRMRVGLHYGP